MTLLVGALTMGLILSLLGIGRVDQLSHSLVPRSHGRRLHHAGRFRGGDSDRQRRRSMAGDRRRLLGRRRGRCDDRRARHALRHQRPAGRHSRDDRALFGEPARHGRANLPLPEHTIVEQAASLASPGASWSVGRWDLPVQDVFVDVAVAGIIALVGAAMYGFFRTNLGLAMRAVGDNEQMIRALGVDTGWMTTFGLGTLQLRSWRWPEPCWCSIKGLPTCRWASAWSCGDSPA